MLKKYIEYLDNYEIPYFWYRNKKLSLLDNLTESQIDYYKEQMKMMLDDVEKNSTSETILKYMHKE